MHYILVTGSNGQLGNELREIASKTKDFHFTFVDIDELDITDSDAVDNYFTNNTIDYCINCAAYTAVDKAEEEKLLALAINANGPKILAAACKKIKATFFHISTDFVFDGKGNTPYSEADQARPLSIYGKSKRKGEVEAMIENPKTIVIRTSWLYSSFGKNFVKTMQKLGKERESMGIVYDQVGTPTYAADLASAIMEIIQLIPTLQDLSIFGLYHYCNAGICSWYDFAKSIFRMSNIEIKVKPILTEEYPLPAKRPTYSVLDTQKIRNKFNIRIPYWYDSLEKCIQKIEKND